MAMVYIMLHASIVCYRTSKVGFGYLEPTAELRDEVRDVPVTSMLTTLCNLSEHEIITCTLEHVSLDLM
jgi:hypothetical protein